MYKNGDLIRVTNDAGGDFARHKGRRGAVISAGLRIVYAQGSIVVGSINAKERMILGYAVRLCADRVSHRPEENVTIPAIALELDSESPTDQEADAASLH